MHDVFFSFIPQPITEHSTLYTSMLNLVKNAKQLDQDALLSTSYDKRVFNFFLMFTSKGKMNFRSLLKYLVDFMQPSVLNIALKSIFKNSESSIVIRRILLMIRNRGKSPTDNILCCECYRYCSKWNKL